MEAPKKVKRSRKLRLYVWKGVFSDYTDGVAFALAHDAKHARKLIAKAMNLSPHSMRELEGPPTVTFSKPYGFGVHGGG